MKTEDAVVLRTIRCEVASLSICITALEQSIDKGEGDLAALSADAIRLAAENVAGVAKKYRDSFWVRSVCGVVEK